MSKIINTSVDNCISCPHCFECRDGHTPDTYLFAFQCTLANKRIGGNKKVTEDTPIPKWCPLPDGNEMMYFVVRESLEEITDDMAVDKTSIDAVKLGNEKYIINTWERDAGFELVDNLNYVAEGKKGWTAKETRPYKVAVILGRLVTEKEVDLSNTQR